MKSGRREQTTDQPDRAPQGLHALAALLVLLNLGLAAIGLGLIDRPGSAPAARTARNGTVASVGATVPSAPAPPSAPSAPSAPAPSAVAAAPPAPPLAAASSAARSAAIPAPSAATPAATPAAVPAPAQTCIEVTRPDAAALAQLERELRTVSANIDRHDERVTTPGWMVYLPPLAERAEGERTVARLRAEGIGDLALILDNSPQRLGISLGIFKTEAAAQTRRADLAARGLRELRIAARGTAVPRTWLRVRGPEPALRAALERAARAQPDQESRACP